LRPIVVPGPEPGEEWDEGDDEALPPEEQPGQQGEQRPNLPANLLDWAPAVRLTNEQRQILANCGVQEHGFADGLVRFALNNDLLEAIAILGVQNF
jgi:hypothetical protein